MIKISRWKRTKVFKVKLKTQKNIDHDQKEKRDEANENEEEKEKESRLNGSNINKKVIKSFNHELKDCTDDNNKRNLAENFAVRMAELKLIPTKIFWIQIMSLFPLMPFFPFVFYPYFDYIHKFQVVWAASLLAFKSGARWTSVTIKLRIFDDQTHAQNSWSRESWGSLASTAAPACLAAFALYLSYPSSYIILTYAFISILTGDLSQNYTMPKGYLELEIITCLLAVLALLCVFIVNVCLSFI